MNDGTHLVTFDVYWFSQEGFVSPLIFISFNFKV